MSQALELIRNGSLVMDSRGRFWRVKKNGRPCQKHRAETKSGKGYLSIAFWDAAAKKVRRVMCSRLIWTILHGPIPGDMEVNHIDTDKSNNKPQNLELLTASENMFHSYRRGRTRPYENTPVWREGKRCLSVEQKMEALRLFSQGAKLREIAAKLKCSTSRVSQIVHELERRSER